MSEDAPGQVRSLEQANDLTYADVLARHPDMPDPLADHVRRLGGIDVLPFEQEAVEAAESTGTHDWGAIAEAVPISAGHASEHRSLGEAIDPDFDERTAGEQRAIGVVAELGDMAEHAETKPTSAYDILTTPELDAFVKRRSSEAIASSEFKATPEVEKAIEGYYTDHYGLAGLVKKLVERSWTDDELAAVIDAPPDENTPFKLYDAKRKLAQFAQLEQQSHTTEEKQAARLAGLGLAAEIVPEVLFSEVCIGQQTLTADEHTVQEKLYGSLWDAGVAEGFVRKNEYSDNPNQYGPHEFKAEVSDAAGTFSVRMQLNVSKSYIFDYVRQQASKNFGAQTRRADQKLFHSTPFLDEVVLNDGLATRQYQEKHIGQFRAGSEGGGRNADGTHHSNAVHFSQAYLSEYGIRRDIESPAGTSGKKPNISNGTIVLPLGDIVQQTPYEGFNGAKLGLVEPKDSSELEAHRKDPFAYGHPGRGGYFEVDDVFYAGWRDKDSAFDYSYPLKDGFILQTTFDRTYDKGVFGIGENFPGYLILDADGRNGGVHNLTEKAKEQIQYIQRLSNPRYEHQLVVPLRSGCLAFEAEYPYQGIPGVRARIRLGARIIS